MAWEIFDLKKEDGVAIATMSRSPGNTYNLDLMHELDEVIEDVRFDNDVKVVVLTGGGDKFFSAGADINMLKTSEPRYKSMFCLHCNETLQELERIPKLVIAGSLLLALGAVGLWLWKSRKPVTAAAQVTAPATGTAAGGAPATAPATSPATAPAIATAPATAPATTTATARRI